MTTTLDSAPPPPAPSPDSPGPGPATSVPMDVPAAVDGRRRRRVGSGTAGVDRVNRAVLAVIGALATAAGVVAFLLDNGGITWSESPASLYRRLAADATGSVDLSAAIAMAICLIAVLLGLRWAAAQLRPVTDGTRVGTIRLDDGPRGRTTAPGGAVAKAAAADFGRLDGVSNARVRLLAAAPVPRAVVTLEVAVDIDRDAVMAAIGEALGRLAGALGAQTVDADVRIRFGKEGSGRGSRVR